ncbi:MAG: hypothetical protein K5867_09260 [Bacteroidales bacterium]|nr:hypothetical protein [Bacteroidales bacterium]
MKQKDKSNQQLAVSSQRPSASERELVQALLTVNNVGLADRCRHYRRRRMAAWTTLQVTAAICLLAVVPVMAAKAIPTHQDYICAISHSGHATANAAAASINTMFRTK